MSKPTADDSRVAALPPQRGYILRANAGEYIPFGGETFGTYKLGKAKWLRQDEQVAAGVYVCRPEEQRSGAAEIFEVMSNETVYMIEGRIHIELTTGETFDLCAGDCASLKKGTVGRMVIVEPVKQFFVAECDRTPNPL